MLKSGGRMFLRFLVLTEIVVMGRLMMMVRGRVVMSGGLMMMLTGRMFWGRCHDAVPPIRFSKQLPLVLSICGFLLFLAGTRE